MGFGHRVYKNYDPRAKILKAACDKRARPSSRSTTRCWTSPASSKNWPCKDPYFIDRKLYPNVDFYSGIIMRAIGIPTNMFTVMFTIGRMPGWIAHWKEQHDDPTHASPVRGRSTPARLDRLRADGKTVDRHGSLAGDRSGIDEPQGGDL